MFSQTKVRLAHLPTIRAAHVVFFIVQFFRRVFLQKIQRVELFKAIKARVF